MNYKYHYNIGCIPIFSSYPTLDEIVRVAALDIKNRTAYLVNVTDSDGAEVLSRDELVERAGALLQRMGEGKIIKRVI